eukprot:s2715_g4.t1
METNRRFKDECQLTYSGRGQETPAQSVKLRDAEMPAYSDICNLSPKTARTMLQQHGVLRGCRDRSSFHCWACGTVMEAADSESKSYRCFAGRSGTQRCRLTDATFAYNPLCRQASELASSAAGGYDPGFVPFLKTAFAVSCKMSQDQTARLTRTKDMSTRAAYEQVQQRKEVDEQGKPVRVHNGRKASKTNKRPLLKGVSHNRDIFTPIAKLDADAIDATTARMLRGEKSMAVLEDGERAVPAGHWARSDCH